MKVLLPGVTKTSWQGHDKVVLSLSLPPELHYFKGHFPAAPILPGVVQTDWAVHFGRAHFKFEGEFKAMEAMRFQQVLMPGDEPELELSRDKSSGALHFRYLSPRGRHSSGTLLFG